MQDSVKNIRESITGKRIERQGYGQVPQVTVINTIQLANGTITSKNVIPGQQEETLVKRAEDMIEVALIRINNFFEGSWKQYRNLAESTKLNLFKDYSPIQ
jgi:hypothetical protein